MEGFKDSRGLRFVEEFGTGVSKFAESQCFGTGTSRRVSL